MLPINSFAMRMAKLGMVIMIFAHTNACLQLLVGKVEPAHNNWLLAEGVYNASKWTQVGGWVGPASPALLCLAQLLLVWRVCHCWTPGSCPQMHRIAVVRSKPGTCNSLEPSLLRHPPG
jgi:hypothetical protein